MTSLVSIEQFRKVFQFQPFHFYGLADASLTPINTNCNDLVHEYAWQGENMAGREDIRQALERAEDKLRGYLGYSIAPHFVTEIMLPPRWYDGRLDRIGYNDASGRWLNIRLSEGKIIEAGIETKTLIGTAAGANLVLSDADGDGLLDTFTATIATTATDPSEIALYFAAADRLDGDVVGERWRITPIKASIAGGVATLKGKAWQIVRPILYEGIGSYFTNPAYAIDPTNASIYASSLEVYRRYCDPTGTTTDTAQAKLIWETRPYPWWPTTPTDNSRDPAAQAYAMARIALRDPERGIVGFGESVYDASTGLWSIANQSSAKPPDRIEVRYLAGVPLTEGQIDQSWVLIVCRLAAAELGRRVTLCPERSKEMMYWQTDRAFVGNATEEKFAYDPDDLSNPFGSRLGHVYAWHEIQNKRHMVGVLG